MAKEARRTTGKSTEKTTEAPEAPPLVPQPHGGALRAAGTPGNRGGTGRPPNEVRRRSRACYEAFLDWAEGYMHSDVAEASIMVQLGKVTSSVGVPKQSEVKHTGLFALAARLEGMSEKELRGLLADKTAAERLLREVNSDGD